MRDLKPFWIYTQAQKILQSKGVFDSTPGSKPGSPNLAGHPNANASLPSGRLSHLNGDARATAENGNADSKAFVEKVREKMVGREIEPYMQHNFRLEATKTSRLTSRDRHREHS